MLNTIQKIFQKQCHLTNVADVDLLMAMIHPLSLSFAQSKQMLTQLFANFELKVEPHGFKYMGKDKTYAYARAQQKVTKVSGPEFKNNIIDQLMVFKLDGDEWKIWTSTVLNIKYLD